MSEILTAIKDWGLLAILGTFAGLVAWLVRLESRAVSNSNNITQEAVNRKTELAALELRLEKQRREDMELRKQDREDLRRMVQDMQSDIKTLLQRTAK